MSPDHLTVTTHKRSDLNHRQLECLFNCLFNLKARMTSKPRITTPFWGESSCDRWIPLTKKRIKRKVFPWVNATHRSAKIVWYNINKAKANATTVCMHHELQCRRDSKAWSFKYRESHCEDRMVLQPPCKAVVIPSYLHNWTSYADGQLQYRPISTIGLPMLISSCNIVLSP